MPKEVAPLKSTSGSGFNFADCVCAYFLSCLLSGRQPFDNSGQIQSIEAEARVDGWYLDDLLLSLSNSKSETRLALSLKSNAQFSDDFEAPAEFVRLAWEQFLQHKSKKFDPGKDLMGLVTAPLDRELVKQREELLGWAREQRPGTLRERVTAANYGNDQKRKLLASFACPADLAGEYDVDPSRVDGLLKCLLFPEFDFDLNPSNSNRVFQEICVASVLSGTQGDAELLGRDLLTIAAKFRASGGYLDRKRLIYKLAANHVLKELPNHIPDWQRIRAYTDSRISAIPNTIGGALVISREQELSEIDLLLRSFSVLVLKGTSGAGKSALAGQYIRSRLPAANVIWLRAKSIGSDSVQSVLSPLGLQNDLTQLLGQASQGVVVLDGLEKVTNDEFPNLKALAQMLGLDEDKPRWKLICTVQEEDWSRAQEQFLRIGIGKFQGFKVGTPKTGMDEVWEKFPTLSQLKFQRQLKSILGNLKILDILARKATVKAFDAKSWVGETSIVDWIWEEEVSAKSDGTVRARFLYLLAEKLADEMSDTVSLEKFQVSELTPLDGLINDRICEKNGDFVSFTHDVFAEWTRLRILISKGSDRVSYVELKVHSPHWHRAVRLYGQYLLEQGKAIDDWARALDQFAGEGGRSSVAQDLLLDAALFAPDPLEVLEKMWPALSGKGRFHRLLTRFLFVASSPNPEIIKLAKGVANMSDTQAALINRIPYAPQYLPFLAFINAHRNDCIHLDLIGVAKVALNWLQATWKGVPGRKDAAELAVTCAERLLAYFILGVFSGYDQAIDKVIYKAGLLSYPEFPDRVQNLVKAACKREEPKGELAAAIESVKAELKQIEEKAKLPVVLASERAKRRPPPILPNFTRRQKMEGWPDGPQGRVDSPFRHVVLHDGGLVAIANENPQLAVELLLAMVIEEPSDRESEYEHSLIREHRGLTYDHEWFPAIFWNGPFLVFLRSKPEVALGCIIKLVNFATERSAPVARNSENPPGVVLRIEGGEKKWLGGFQTYYWFRSSASSSNIVASALMAVEKWLYEFIDGGGNPDPFFKHMLQSSTSVAFAGLLIAVGKRYPKYFLGALKPLSVVPIFMYWERRHRINGESYLEIGFSNKADQIQKAAFDWFRQDHHKNELLHVVLPIFIDDKDFREYAIEFSEDWEEQLAIAVETEDDIATGFFENTALYFDWNNYQEEKIDGKSQRVFSPPASTVEKQAAREKNAQEQMLLLTFPNTCRDLLNGKARITEGAEESFWQHLQYISKLSPNTDTEPGVIDVADSILGGIAVLVLLRRKWLSEHGDYEKWCKEQVLRIIDRAPPASRMRSENESRDYRWDSFCSEIVAVFWAESPNNSDWREAAAVLCTSYYHGVVADFFYACSKQRSRLGADFRRLMRLMAEWASRRIFFDHALECPGLYEESRESLCEKVLKRSWPFVFRSLKVSQK